MKKVVFFLFVFNAITSCKTEEEVIPVAASPKVEDKTKAEFLPIDIPENHVVNFKVDTLSYLALGDSYTIGTGVEKRYRWPNQLVENLGARNIHFREAKIVAGAGWTADNLLKVLKGRNLDPKYDLVSLLIGVNNQYQGSLFGDFQRDFIELIKFSLEKAKSRSSVFVLSIPDYGVTPFGGNQSTISDEIDMYNSWIEDMCAVNQIKLYHITEISRKAENDLSLLAKDQLHPSANMYSEWIEMIVDDLPKVLVQE